jgi:hypothetical protein
MRRARLGWLVLLVSMAALTGTARANWTPPLAIGVSGGPPVTPEVALDAAGDSTFVWQRLYGPHDSRVQLRQRSADGTLGPARTISTPGYAAGSVRGVDVAPNGDAVVVWGLHRVQARALAADGTLGPIQAISPRADGYFFPQPQVVVDRFGNATFLWTGPGDEFLSRMRFADGTLGPVHRLPGGNGWDRSVGVDAAGDAIFAWVGEHGQGIRACVRTLDGTWGPIRRVTDGPASSLLLAVNPGGDAVFAWTRGFDDASLVSRSLAADGTFSPAARISPSVSGDIDVAMTAAGRAVFVWWVLTGDPGVIQARTRAPSGSLTQVQTLSRGFVGAPDVGVDEGGNAVFTWWTGDGVELRTRANDGALGPTTMLGPGDPPSVAVNPAGDATVAWNSGVREQAAFGP